MSSARAAEPWPVRHVLQLLLLLLVLQPLLLLLTLLDAPREWASDAGVASFVAQISRILRPGARVDGADGARRVWEAAMALQGLLIVQFWFCMRLGAWARLSEGYEKHETPAQLAQRRQTLTQQLEVRTCDACADSVHDRVFPWRAVPVARRVPRACARGRACEYVLSLIHI